VPDGVCSEDPAEPELHTVEPDALHVQQGTGTLQGGSARESQAAVHFLLTKETGLVKIRNSFILVIECLHDFFIGLCSPICWHESRTGANSCRGRPRILLVCKAPTFRHLCRSCIVLVIAQVLCDQEMYRSLLTVFHRVAPAATHALCLCAFTEWTSRALIRASIVGIRASLATQFGTCIRVVGLRRRTVVTNCSESGYP
jgi:hypothetical protein